MIDVVNGLKGKTVQANKVSGEIVHLCQFVGFEVEKILWREKYNVISVFDFDGDKFDIAATYDPKNETFLFV